jgi:2-polyprenyl-3-methyl-5-hydroxy-6-metoxy-1,4-benzoquinol methylase
MISFRHGPSPVTLKPGELWAAPGGGGSYRDLTEESLWAIIRQIEAGTPWRDAVSAYCASNNPWLHQIITNPARALFFQQHPPPPGAQVLDIGAGWGQISLPLARRDDNISVMALEPTRERLAFIRAAAAQERLMERMQFVQADFLDLEFGPSFDLVCCVGVLEWVPQFHPGDPRSVQLEFLRRMRSALRPGGQCCIGIENRLGLKYILGARDDHTAQRNVSVFDAALAQVKHRTLTGKELRAFTYTHAEYQTLFQEAGFEQVETYAAFPDYKLPRLILPVDPPADFNRSLLAHPIPPEHDGIDGQLLPQPEEYVSHYHSLARMGVAHCFSPSFFFVLR